MGSEPMFYGSPIDWSEDVFLSKGTCLVNAVTVHVDTGTNMSGLLTYQEQAVPFRRTSSAVIPWDFHRERIVALPEDSE